MHTTPLKHLFPGWFAIVMGWSGLALAWQRAAPVMGELAQGLAMVAGGIAAVVFVLLAGAMLLRWQRHAEAMREDLAHPVRHTFFATLPISAMLLATLAMALFGPSAPGAEALWWAGSLAQFGAAVGLVDEQLARTGTYVAGAQFTLADIVVFHCLVWALSAKLELPGEASLAYIDRLKTRAAYVRAIERERVEAERHEAEHLQNQNAANR